MAKSGKFLAKDSRELDRAYAQLTGRPVRKRKKRSPWPALLCIVLLLTVLGGLVYAGYRYTALFDDILTMPDVTMAGISMEGKTKQQAKAALEAAAAEYAATDMVVQVRDTQLCIAPAQAGLDTAGLQAAVDDAFHGDARGSFDLLPYLGLEEAAVTAALAPLDAAYNTKLTPTTAQVTGQVPDLTHGDPEAGLTLTVTMGKPQYGLDTDALARQVLQAYNSRSFRVEAECTLLEPETPDLAELCREYTVDPVDAVMDPQTFAITPGTYGYGMDADALAAALEGATYGQQVLVEFEKLPPQVTAEALGATLFRDVLGTASTPYKGVDSNNRNTNLAIACEAINGLVLLPGETFNYNATLGERTADKGYKEAPSYVGGLTVDTLGGGICQISSTLYYATLYADLEIVERHNHGYVSDYIDPGMDATVTWGGANFRFRNDTAYPIRIEAWRAEGRVNVVIYGTDERDYYVELTYSIVSTTPYETVYREMTADNPDGYYDGQVIVTPYTGHVVKSYKQKYDKQTGELISEELKSRDTYKKRDMEICRIVAATEPTEDDGAVG